MDQTIPTHISVLSASISGSIHILVGHPFDTIKTIVQGNKNYDYKTTTMRTLFRGVKYPLIQNTISNSLLFGINNYINHSLQNIYLGNFYTSVISTFILIPFDKYKVMTQYNKPYPINITNIMRSYKQIPIVSMTEIPSTFVYFSVYHKMRTMEYNSFISGGFAGLFSWLCIYPLDTIKVRLQSETCSSIKQAYSMGHLTNGIYICMMRSMLVNGVNFYCYEKLNGLFTSSRV